MVKKDLEKLYRDRVALWLHDNAGNLLVQDDRDQGLGLKFPGGGIDEGQSVNDAAIREALEEVGYSLAGKPRAIPGVRARKIDWDPVFSAEAAAKGRNYKGSKHYHRLALAGDPDESLLGSEGDALAANWMPIGEVLEATRNAAANPDNKYNYFDEERLRAAERVYAMLTSKTANYRDPLILAYKIGQKLATADFGDNGSSDDATLSFDNEIYQKIDPKDFASPEDHGNMTPRTNSQTWLGLTDEVNPDETQATNYKRDYLERT
jgi:8-oxo-dGTP pyrophosphatase MutT (NUDIX family)